MKTIKKELELPMNEHFPWFDQRTTMAFDIETTGFSKQSNFIYLIGYSYQVDNKIVIKQLLARNRLDEFTLLQSFFEDCLQYSCLLTFNGDQFDIPFIIARGNYHHLSTLAFEQMQRIDLYKRLKPYKKFLPIPSAKQKSFEEFLHTGRIDEMDGGQLIQVYYEYEKTANSVLENLLLLHNFEDVNGLLEIQKLAVYEDLLHSQYINQSNYVLFEQSSEVLIIQDHSLEIPKQISFRNKFGYFHIEHSQRKLLLKIKKGLYQIPLLPYKDYVYLISEDTVIPKALASTVDLSNLKKANAKNCFLRTESECIDLPVSLKEQLDVYHIPVLYPQNSISPKFKTIAITKDDFFSHSDTLVPLIANQLFHEFM